MKPFAQINRDVCDDTLSEILRNNAEDVGYAEFHNAFQRAIPASALSAQPRDIVQADEALCDRVIRWLFHRNLRTWRKHPGLRTLPSSLAAALVHRPVRPTALCDFD